MKIFLLTLLVGAVFGFIDILPMLRMKLDKFSIASAYVFYLIVPFVIYNTNMFGMPWWLKGGVITFVLALPVVILVVKDGLKATMPIAVMSVVLGTLIGLAGHLLVKVM